MINRFNLQNWGYTRQWSTWRRIGFTGFWVLIWDVWVDGEQNANINMFQHPPRGGVWTLRGCFMAPQLPSIWHPLEGPGLVSNMYITTKCVHIFGDGHLSLKATQRISNVYLRAHWHQIWSSMPPLTQRNIEETYNKQFCTASCKTQCPISYGSNLNCTHTQNTSTLNFLHLESTLVTSPASNRLHHRPVTLVVTLQKEFWFRSFGLTSLQFYQWKWCK